MNASLPADDTPDWISRDIHTIGRVTAIPTLLKIVCDTTGMRFAAVARVTEKTWTVCAVRDALGVGFIPGSTLDVEKTLCVEAMRQRQPIVIDHASADRRIIAIR